jgi:peptide deformylase
MAVQKLIRFPRPSLREPCREVVFPLTKEVLNHLQDLRDTLATIPSGVGLASNQILERGWRIFVTRKDLLVPYRPTNDGPPIRRGGKFYMPIPEIFINPEWEPYPPTVNDQRFENERPEHDGYVEGCLSIPELAMLNKREYWAEVLYQDETGRQFVWYGRSLAARIIQHECDHLAGKLLFDYAPRALQSKVRVAAMRNRKRGE